MPEFLDMTELRWRLHQLLKGNTLNPAGMHPVEVVRPGGVDPSLGEDSCRWSGPTLHLLKELSIQEELYPSLGEDSYRWSGPTCTC